MSSPIARCIRIDLDNEEMPAQLYLTITADIRERVLRDFPMHTVQATPGLFEARPAMGEAADMARYFGHLPGHELGEEGSEFYYCITNVANRFWDNGLDEAPTAGLVAKSAEATA